MTPDTIFPHPYSMSLAVTIFVRPVGKATGAESYHAVYDPQLQKNPGMADFLIRLRSSCVRAAAQDVDSMGDS